MIPIAVVTVLLAVLMVTPTIAVAATDVEKFRARVGSSAPESLDATPPVVCICLRAGEFMLLPA